MTEKRYSHNGVVIVDHLKEDLIYIDGKDELLELAEYVDRLQEENTELKNDNHNLSQKMIKALDRHIRLEKENEQLKSENEKYGNIFFEIVKTALIDKKCRELYCKGVLDIFDEANSLDQAKEIIKEHLE